MTDSPPVGGVVILAAGRSRRFGTDKRAHRLTDGRTLLEHSIGRYGGAFPHCLVVIRPDDPERSLDDGRARYADGGSRERGKTDADHCSPAPPDHPTAPVFIRAPDADLGMGHSLAAGVRAVDGWDYLFVALADMPWVRATTLAALRAAMEHRCQAAATIVVPVFEGRPGHPVGFSRALFGDLRQLRGDAGARAVLQANPSAIVRIEVDDPGILRDLDTPDQAGAD